MRYVYSGIENVVFVLCKLFQLLGERLCSCVHGTVLYHCIHHWHSTLRANFLQVSPVRNRNRIFILPLVGPLISINMYLNCQLKSHLSEICYSCKIHSELGHLIVHLKLINTTVHLKLQAIETIKVLQMLCTYRSKANFTVTEMV